MTRSTPLNVARFLAILTLVLHSASSYAQDVLAEIAKHQERIVRIENDFRASQRRILASVNTMSAQELTYEHLNSVGNILSSAYQEFQALTYSLMLAALVTDKRAIPQARRIVEAQEEAMARQFQANTKFTEKTLASAKDPETNRLLLDARDVLKASTDLVIRLKTSNSKGLATK